MKNTIKHRVAIAAFTLILGGCTEATFPEPKTPIVELQQIPEIKVSRVQNYPAVVQASELTHLSFQLNGEINNLIATEGMVVKKGDLLAQLEDTTYRLSVNEAKAKVELSKVRAERARVMVEKGNMAKSMFEELDVQYQQAVAEYNLAKIHLSYVDLKAPFDGIISSVIVENYQATSIGSPAIIMHRTDKVEVVASLPDSLMASIDRDNVKGSALTFTVKLDAYPGQEFDAKYREITAEQSNENRTFSLTLEMPFIREMPALQGMPGSITLDLSNLERQKTTYATVPLEALTLPDELGSDQFERIVWRVNGTKVEPVRVLVTRLSALGSIEVIGDIKPGDQVVVSGMQYLKPNMEVIIKNNPEAM